MRSSTWPAVGTDRPPKPKPTPSKVKGEGVPPNRGRGARTLPPTPPCPRPALVAPAPPASPTPAVEPSMLSVRPLVLPDPVVVLAVPEARSLFDVEPGRGPKVEAEVVPGLLPASPLLHSCHRPPLPPALLLVLLAVLVLPGACCRVRPTPGTAPSSRSRGGYAGPWAAALRGVAAALVWSLVLPKPSTPAVPPSFTWGCVQGEWQHGP